MKTHSTSLLRGACIALLAACALPAFSQEAFYIYRNDGGFDGFFFDDVQRMGVSKVDLQGVEHDDYVVQEIEVADTTYRIALSAIDSVGFQQPDIILSPQLSEINGEGSPAQTSSYYFEGDDGFTLKWRANTAEGLPTVGMILTCPEWKNGRNVPDANRVWAEGPFVGKVKSVTPPEDKGNLYGIVCEPIEDLSEVFEQFITVEQIGTDKSGKARHRMAGLNKLRRRVEGNKDLTLVNLNGKFPFSRGNDDFSVTLSLDLALKVRATVSYNISRSVKYIGVMLKEDAEVGVSFTAKANLEDVTTWHIAGLPVYFPSILPIFQLDPSPQAFIKTTGDLSLTVSSPKFAFHGTQDFHLGTDRISGTCKTDCPAPGSEDNGWSMSVSLNGSLQAGSNFPMKLETNRWAEKAIYAAVGADVFVGPRLTASFAVDPVAAAKGELYPALSGTNITLSPMCTVFEANAEYSFGKKPRKKEKFFEGEKTFFDMSLLLFPEFEKTQVTKQPEDSHNVGTVEAKALPHGNSLPYVVGLAAYNKDKQLVYKTYNTLLSGDSYAREHTYSFFSTYDELPASLSVLDGTYSIVPLINAFGYDVPAWGSEVEVSRSLVPYVTWPKDGSDGDKNPTTGLITVAGLMPGDNVDFELVKNYYEERTFEARYYADDEGKVRKEVFRDETKTGTAGSVSTSESKPWEAWSWFKVGPEQAGATTFAWRNNCTSWYKGNNMTTYDSYWPESGGKWTLSLGGWAPPGFTENRYGYSYHYEACTYRIVVTRADGRKFTLPDEYNFCGYGKTETHDKIYGDKSYYQFRAPSDYGVEGYLKDSAE